MSRWFPEAAGLAALTRGSLRVSLSPSAVELVRLSGGLRPGIVHAVRHPVSPGRGPAGATPWRAAVDTAAEALRAEPRLLGAPAHVAVSGHWVRWQVIAFGDSLTVDAEIESYARMEFEAVHGDRVSGWAVAVAAPRAGCALPACALDATLPGAVRAAFAGAGVKLVSLSAGFALAFDRHRRRLGSGARAFAWVEPGRCTLGVLQDGAWRVVTSPRVSGDPAAALAPELAAATGGGAVTEPGTLHVVFATGRRAMPAELAGWRVNVLEEPAVPFAPAPAGGPAPGGAEAAAT